MVEKCLAGLGINDGTKELMFHGLVKRLVKFTQLIRRLVNIKNELQIRYCRQ
jgi:hypothetical protein